MKDRYKQLMKRSVDDAYEVWREEFDGDEGPFGSEEVFVAMVMGLYTRRAGWYEQKRMMAKQAAATGQGSPDIGRH
jgi:hypothetical protein